MHIAHLSTMSKGSDASTSFLVPVGDVLSENQILREVVGLHKYVEITGSERQPIYARGDLQRDCFLHPGGKDWCVKLQQVEACPVRDLRAIEVWVGSSRQAIFREKVCEDDETGNQCWDDKMAFIVGSVGQKCAEIFSCV